MIQHRAIKTVVYILTNEPCKRRERKKKHNNDFAEANACNLTFFERQINTQK